MPEGKLTTLYPINIFKGWFTKEGKMDQNVESILNKKTKQYYSVQVILGFLFKN